MKKEVMALSEDKEALSVLRNRFKIDETRFEQGLLFAQGIIDGQSKNKAYAEAFGVDTDKARRVSSQFHRGKWIQALISYLRPEEDSLYFGEVKAVIAANMRVIRDIRSSPREVAECTKAVQPFIKAEKLRLEVDVDVKDNTGESTVTKLTDQISILMGMGKMINETGDIIDVEPIE